MQDQFDNKDQIQQVVDDYVKFDSDFATWESLPRAIEKFFQMYLARKAMAGMASPAELFQQKFDLDKTKFKCFINLLNANEDRHVNRLLYRFVSRYPYFSVKQLGLLSEMLVKSPKITDHMYRELDHWIQLDLNELAAALKENRAEIGALADEFIQEQREIEALLLANISDYFDFENPEKRHQRIRLMQDLQREGVFSVEGSDALLHAGFNLYITKTQEILNSQSQPNSNKSKIGDLNVKQHHHLLRLADELREFGHLPHGNPQTLQPLRDNLHNLIHKYQKAWFKSDAREQQVAGLERQLNAILDNQDAPRYGEIVQKLQEVRVAAMESDKEVNKNRLFKLHRSGHSRFFETLNRMEDMVLRHWVNDPGALKSFANYSKKYQKEFLELTRELHTVMEVYHQERYPEKSKRVLGGFFDSRKTEEDFNHMMTALNQIIDSPNDVTKDEIKHLSDDLKKVLPKLPGHVAVLVNEVIERGDALVEHLGSASFDR